MLKLLIVDDEQAILEGLKVVVDWNKNGVEIIGTAQNGKEALQKAVTLKPDIILTDIRMPEMNGLDLIKSIKSELPETQCILLTGYQDFEYARQALNNGAVGYLLKPVDEDELLSLINTVREKVSIETHEEKKLAYLNIELNKTTTHMQSQLLYSLVNGEGGNIDEKLKTLEAYGINYLPERYLCFIIDFEFDSDTGIFNSSDTELVKFAVSNITNEIVNTKTKGIVFYTAESKIIGLAEIKEEKTELINPLFEEILNSIGKFLKLNAIIGVSLVHSELKTINICFKEANRALKYNAQGKNIIYFKDIEEKTGQIYNFPNNTEKKLVNCIFFGDVSGINEILNEVYEDLDNFKIDTDGFLFALRDLIALIRRNMEELKYDDTKFIQQTKLFFDFAQSYSINQLRANILELLTSLSKDIFSVNTGRGNAIIYEIKQYIDENYAQQLTLNGIADRFFIHSSYLSRLFKRETGENFIDYLTKKRIDESIRLLIGTDLKVYEVSEKVGYGNPKYFSQLFEKYTGTTPKEFRNNMK